MDRSRAERVRARLPRQLSSDNDFIPASWQTADVLFSYHRGGLLLWSRVQEEGHVVPKDPDEDLAE